MAQVMDYSDDRASVATDLKGDKYGLGVAMIRKHRLSAQNSMILLMQLAHNVLLWVREWLSKAAHHVHRYDILRLIKQVWAIPGRLKFIDQQIWRVRLRTEHPRTRDVTLASLLSACFLLHRSYPYSTRFALPKR